MINPTSLPGVHIQNDGIMQCMAAQLFLLDQTDSDTTYVTTSMHAAIASHIPSRGKRRPQYCRPVNKAKLIGWGRLCKQDCHAQVTDYM